MATKTYRQGDILLVKVDGLPDGEFREASRDSRGRWIVAEGEVTGHAHALEGEDVRILEDPADIDRRFIEIMTANGLTHDEHDTIMLDPGVYEIRRQREYEPGPAGQWGTRQVTD